MDFYTPYFELTKTEILNDALQFEKELIKLEILKTTDSKNERAFFTKLFHELLSLFTLPFQKENFDFADTTFFDKISALAETYTKNDDIKKMDSNRGSKHFIYINRTFFGLYSLMHQVKASNIDINRYKNYLS